MDLIGKTFWDMVKLCISFVQQHQAIWEEKKMIKDDVDVLIATEKELSEAAVTQAQSETAGIVAQKNQQFQDLGKAIYPICCNLSHLATKTNDQVLLKSVDYSESKLLSGEEREILIRFETILKAANEKLTLLEAYEVTAEKLNDLNVLLDALKKLPDTIDLLGDNRKSATRNINDLIGILRETLNLLDKAIEGMITDEHFIEGWFEARKIKGRPRKKDNGNDEENKEK